jgi:hypothetical protein
MSNFLFVGFRLFVFSFVLIGVVGTLPAQETAILQPIMNTLPEIPDYRDKWMSASPNERIRMAEEIGEAGAERFAKSKGWKLMLVKSYKNVAQGVDQVYQSADGLIHVVEAKGGTSQLGNGYGYKQGTPEWSVEASKATLKNPKASAIEKVVAQKVLQAAAEGKLVTHTIRTGHVLGKPMIPVVESMLKTTPAAKKLAQQSLDDVRAKSPAKKAPLSNVAKKATSSSNVTKLTNTTAITVVPNLGKTVVKAAPVVGTAFEVGGRGYSSYKTEQDYKNGKISQIERVENHAGNVGSCVGGATGAWGGATGGAMVGATIGSVIPGPGTAVGGVVGGILGGFGGCMCGDYVGNQTGRAATKLFR